MAKASGIGSHHSPSAETHTWLTPPDLLKALGPFDLDPCAAPEPRPWPTAAIHYTEEQDGLALPWAGRVWCNPPYGQSTHLWLAKLAEHGDGVALVFARTETAAWFEHIWPKAHAICFLRGRLHFYDQKGERAKNNSGGPSALIAYGEHNVGSIAGLDGRLVRLEPKPAAAKHNPMPPDLAAIHGLRSAAGAMNKVQEITGSNALGGAVALAEEELQRLVAHRSHRLAAEAGQESLFPQEE